MPGKRLGRCIRVPAGDVWHDRGVDHSQTLHAAHSQASIHHGPLVLAHATTDEDLGEWVKRVATTMWHPVGKCP